MLEGDRVGRDVLLHPVLARFVGVPLQNSSQIRRYKFHIWIILRSNVIGLKVQLCLGFIQAGALPRCDRWSWSVSLTSCSGWEVEYKKEYKEDKDKEVEYKEEKKENKRHI